MNKFPFDHVVDPLNYRVWIKCDSSITAMSICSVVNKYYPGFTGYIASDDYFSTLKQKQV